jgi:hypothetical protein
MNAKDRFAKGNVDSLAQGMNIGPTPSGDMSKIDALIEVARTLKDARSVAEGCSNKTLIYFMDMAIFEVCEALAALRSPGSAYGAQKPVPRCE